MTKFFAGSGIAQSPEQGPLDVIIPTYAAFLSQQGYSKLSARQQMRFLADMNRWLHQKRLQVTIFQSPQLNGICDRVMGDCAPVATMPRY